MGRDFQFSICIFNQLFFLSMGSFRARIVFFRMPHSSSACREHKLSSHTGAVSVSAGGLVWDGSAQSRTRREKESALVRYRSVKLPPSPPPTSPKITCFRPHSCWSRLTYSIPTTDYLLDRPMSCVVHRKPPEAVQTREEEEKKAFTKIACVIISFI